MKNYNMKFITSVRIYELNLSNHHSKNPEIFTFQGLGKNIDIIYCLEKGLIYCLPQ